MMMNYTEIQALLIKRNFYTVAETDKIIALRSNILDQPIYLNKTGGSSASTIVIHPQFESHRDKLFSIPGIKTSGDRWYHNSNLRLFPTRDNKGKTPSNYGIPLGLESEADLDRLLRALQKDTDVELDPFTDIAAAEEDLADCSETTRESLVKARIGQGQFRAKLIEYWDVCAVTGCDFAPVLIASHIKPWRDSSNADRLNPFNGLLLTPNLDQAFDQGFITFENDGKVLLSSRLNEQARIALGLHTKLKLRNIDPKHLPFFGWHRSQIFQK